MYCSAEMMARLKARDATHCGGFNAEAKSLAPRLGHVTRANPWQNYRAHDAPIRAFVETLSARHTTD